MANLKETSVWEPGIYQFETSDPVMGGENGVDNRPPRQLANRTLWLKDQVAALNTKIPSQATASTPGIAKLVNNLTGGGTDAALTAEQGKVLAGMIGNINSGKADKASSFAGYGLSSSQDLTGNLALSGQAWQSLSLVPSGGVHRLQLETTGDTAYFVWRDKSASSGGKLYRVPVDRDAGTLATFGVTLAHYGITDAAGAAEVAQAAPSGTIAYFATNTAPAGWLKANGAAVSRTVYAALFAAIGTRFGVGDGSTTFRLPDLRGEFIRGWDDGRGADSGRGIGSWQADEIKAHTHGGVPVNKSDFDRGVGQNSYFSLDDQGVTAAAGGAETRPRNVALLACIKI